MAGVADDMKVLVVSCPARTDSYTVALAAAAADGARAGGHAVQVLDLRALRFAPVLEDDEHRAYDAPEAADLAPHIDALRWADALVIVAPVWWGGPPARLKGWLDRVWRPGVAFTVAPDGSLRPGFAQLRRLEVVATLGGPAWAFWLAGQPMRRMLLRALRPCIARRARTGWMALAGLDGTTLQQRAAFLDRVRQRARSF